MRLFTKSNKQIIGVDITTTAVKMVEITRQQGLFHLKNYGIESLARGMVADKEIKDIETVSEVINKLSRSLGLSSKNVATAVSSASVISKIIDMDTAMADTDREARIRLDADQYIPYPLEEVNLDFEVLGPSITSEGQSRVLLVASRSENVDQRVEVMSLAGLEAKVVDVESYAIERAFQLIVDSLPGQPQNVALIDIGHQQTTLYIAKDGEFVYSREQLFGGGQLTESIQNRYGLTYEEAMTNKRNMTLPDDYQSDVLMPFLDSIVQQITRSLQFYFSSSQSHQVDHILLSGGTASLSGLAAMVQQKLGSSTSIANPFANMTIDSKVNTESLLVDSPSLMAACGLALRSFD
ncbi:type IV pilus assembly protein PilM [Moraxella macacae 0408225]|uniref:Type IV pilus assembly protein PilM n=1 Tax=Moraxella macacae 0408225 TaxID=1230338 RepID=L2F8P2_9GAMM|nr:pilus assembly protein PilM [Moraxella macacae]ELA09439.1 type IV pilus assembly protein PilM [Moraxella macacae 0408225]